jgi:hypothetical protein
MDGRSGLYLGLLNCLADLIDGEFEIVEIGEEVGVDAAILFVEDFNLHCFTEVHSR